MMPYDRPGWTAEGPVRGLLVRVLFKYITPRIIRVVGVAVAVPSAIIGELFGPFQRFDNTYKRTSVFDSRENALLKIILDKNFDTLKYRISIRMSMDGRRFLRIHLPL